MKVIIATVQAPFVMGGAEFLAANLKMALVNAGHDAEIVALPFVDEPVHLIEKHVVIARLTEILYTAAGYSDLCIGLKFPAYFVPHPNKVCWVLHQHRKAYDLYDTPISNMPHSHEGLSARKMVVNADNLYLPEAKRIYTIAKNVSFRMKKFNGIDSDALYHPCPDMDKFYCSDYEDYILMPSRINVTKRQMLALEALCYTKRNVKLYFVGKADHEHEKRVLTDFVAERKLHKKVRFFDFVTHEEKIKLYANAKAVLFIPMDEDYGYITLEAMASSKAVITASDSGGPLEFVETDKTGIVCNPSPRSIAEAIDQIYSSRDMYRKLGVAGKEKLESMNITWDRVVRELTKV